MSDVDLRLVEVALDHATSTDFESFFQSFYPSLVGIDFVPLGGMHDGGADAFQDTPILEGRGGRKGTFYQATTQSDHRSKIRQTVKRLKEYGRDPQTLVYVTSRTVGAIDIEEERLAAELDVEVKIRGRKWITSHINHSAATIAAFNSYLRPQIEFLTAPGAADLLQVRDSASTKAMCVFLGQEVDRRRGNTELLEAVTDSLILWALEGTDPDKSAFLTRDQILTKIEQVLPSAKHFIRGVMDQRLSLLSDKGNPTGRELRRYRKDGKYCLPFETRQLIERENVEDEFHTLQLVDLYTDRAARFMRADDTVSAEAVAAIARRALNITFECEGIELAEFLSGVSEDNYNGSIADHVDLAIDEFELSGAAAVMAKAAALEVLRQAFYKSTEVERLYYGKLSRAYTLMFTLRNEPRIVEYFRGMSSSFVLFVGADIIIRALSERYLPETDQMTVNMLEILKAAGSTLLLTEMAVNEIYAHLKVSDNEFRHWFADLEYAVDRNIARHSKMILVRAYFYARQDSTLRTRPRSWGDYIGQVCSYVNLYREGAATRQIREYLVRRFGFSYLDREALEALAQESEVAPLAKRLAEIKAEEVLARNDAIQIIAVYGNRRKIREEHKPNIYGYRTWWLTHEAKVLSVTQDLVRAKGAPYIIRPEFILNFVALSPTTEEVRRSYNTIFPTLLGVRLSNRMREDVFHDVMRRAKEVKRVDEARAAVMMSEMSNQLKGDSYKTYEVGFESRSGRIC